MLNVITENAELNLREIPIIFVQLNPREGTL